MGKRLNNRLRSDKRLLIYAHYYYPDVAATGQLLMELAEGLSDRFAVRVICAVPSYSGKVAQSYQEKWIYKENIHGIKVLRVRVPAFSKRIKSSRVKNIVAYAVRAMLATFLVGGQDYVLSISQPPVLGGLLGVWGSFWKRARFIYSIQDFNPEQIQVVGYTKKQWLLNLMMKADVFSCRHAHKIILPGHDMEATLQARFRAETLPASFRAETNSASLRDRTLPDYTVIHNWVDEKEIRPLPAGHEKVRAFKQKYGLDDRFVIMYSGNIGLYYDLENLIKVLKRYRKAKVAFVFVGAGSVLSQLILYKEKDQLDNIFFVPYQDKEELVYSLNAADVHWCVNAMGMKGVSFPSKCFGIMAAGKPVLGVLEPGSGARELIELSGCGICCTPGDYKRVAELIDWFMAHAGSSILTDMGMSGRSYLVSHFARDKAFRLYAEAIAETDQNNRQTTG